MFERRYNDGDPIYLAGEASEAVFRIRRGKVRSTADGASRVSEARVLGPGDLLGALQLLSGRPRSENAHAVGDVILEAITRAELLRLLETEASAAHVAVSALFDHMKITADAGRVSKPSAVNGEPRSDWVANITVFGANKQVQDHIGTRGVVVESLPFRVGRLSATVSPTEESVHLQFPDPRPYFMSRRHFSIERNGPELLVRDSGSHSGTLVNGVAIGARAPSSTARLAPGRNDVVAGREDSPFRFIIVVETADPTRS